MTLEDGRNIATVIAAFIALVVYATNSVQQHRQRVIDNAIRFVTAHQRFVASKFIRDNWPAMEAGTFTRDTSNSAMEAEFSRLLGEIEYLALLQRTGALSQTLFIYMFGWWAQRIQPILRVEERNSVYWELAVRFLDEMKQAADDFYKLTKTERDSYHNQKHFWH
jgi:hypothetical protein